MIICNADSSHRHRPFIRVQRLGRQHQRLRALGTFSCLEDRLERGRRHLDLGEVAECALKSLLTRCPDGLLRQPPQPPHVDADLVGLPSLADSKPTRRDSLNEGRGRTGLRLPRGGHDNDLVAVLAGLPVRIKLPSSPMHAHIEDLAGLIKVDFLPTCSARVGGVPVSFGGGVRCGY